MAVVANKTSVCLQEGAVFYHSDPFPYSQFCPGVAQQRGRHETGQMRLTLPKPLTPEPSHSILE